MGMPQEQREQPKKVTGGAFGRFLAEQRAALTEECKGKPASAVVTLASERYKALGEAERSSYNEKYKQAVQQYEEDMKSFLAAGGEKKVIKKKTAAANNSPPAKTPVKRGRQPSTETPPSKRERKTAGDASSAPMFDAKVKEAAEKEGLTSSLSNLASRPEIVARGLKPAQLLKALKENGGS